MSENKPKLEKIWLDNTGTATCADRGDENRYVPYADYKKAIDALKFYANPENWEVKKFYDGEAEGVIDYDDVGYIQGHGEVGGFKARAVLQELGEDRGDG